MSNDNQDLLDLCRLNLMEENVKDSSAWDRDSTMQAIDWKKRQLVTQIKARALKESKDGRFTEDRR